ncbi:MAG: type II toxin-antitoxin system VapC family toxin [Chthoniobacterales bacterium]
MEVKFALDTNRLIDFLRGLEDVVEKLRLAESVYVPVIVLGEMRSGFSVGAKAAANEVRLTQFLATRRVHLLPIDEETSFHYARLFAALRKRGAPISQNDLWIAALVSQHGLPLYSRDAHFRQLPELRLI